MSMFQPEPGQGQPVSQAGSSGPLSGFNVPWIVLLAAGLPVLAAVLLAVVGAVVASVVASEPFDAAVFPALLGLLSGNEVGASAASEMFNSGGSGSAGVRFLPLGMVTISALALNRVEFTRAWLAVGWRQFGWAPPVAGALMVLAAWFLAMVTGSFTGVDVGLASANMSARPTLTGLLLVGAGPWLLAKLMVRWPVARNLVHGLVGLQVLFAVALTIYVLTDVVGDPWMSGGQQVAALVTTALGGVLWSLNGVVALLWWPFLGAMGVGGSAAAIGSVAGESMRMGFFEAAGEVPWLWLLPPIGVAGIAALAWLQPPPTSWTDVRLQVGRLTVALGVVFLLALWAGRIRMTGRGDFAGEFMGELFWMGPTGQVEAQVDATMGAVGMPLRFLPALLAWALLAFLVAVLAAQSSGATWARSDTLASEARRAGGSLAARAKAAANAAQQAAVQSGQHTTTTGNTPGAGPPPAARPPMTGHPPPRTPPDAPPPSGGVPPSSMPPQPQDPTRGAPPSQGPPADWASAPPPAGQHWSSSEAGVPPVTDDASTGDSETPPWNEPTEADDDRDQQPSWRDAPPPEPGTRRD